MNEEYTVTTEQVRETYELGSRLPAQRRTDFDRWLAAHDAQVKAEALEEAADVVLSEIPRTSPYRSQDAAVVLRSRAAEYRSGERT